MKWNGAKAKIFSLIWNQFAFRRPWLLSLFFFLSLCLSVCLFICLFICFSLLTNNHSHPLSFHELLFLSLSLSLSLFSLSSLSLSLSQQASIQSHFSNTPKSMRTHMGKCVHIYYSFSISLALLRKNLCASLSLSLSLSHILHLSIPHHQELDSTSSHFIFLQTQWTFFSVNPSESKNSSNNAS